MPDRANNESAKRRDGRAANLELPPGLKLLRTLEGHTAPIGTVAFSPDGSLLASTSADGSIRLWRCDKWEWVASLPRLGSSMVVRLSLAFHPQWPVLAAASAWPDTSEYAVCKFIHLWDLDYAVLLGQKLGQKPAEKSGHYRNAKVVLVGNTSVGKSGLGLVLAGRKFRPTESTHGRHIWQFETEPFAGVAYWARALDQAHSGFPLKKFLVAARIDRGGVAVSKQRVEEQARKFGRNAGARAGHPRVRRGA